MTKSLVSTFAGNDAFVIGVFTLNIFPYINASILIQLLLSIFPSLSKLQKEGGGEGRRTTNKLTRLITLGWALIQSFSIAFYLKRVLFDWDLYLAGQIIIWLTTGAMIVLWLSKIITEYGLGNGASLLIYTNIVSNLPNFGKNLFLTANENISIISWGLISLLFFVAIYGIVLLQEGTRVVPLKSSKIINWISYFVLILLFSSFYSTIVLNPKDISNDLQKMAVSIPGIRPGVETTFYLKKVMQRVTYLGAIMLSILATIPNFIEAIIPGSSFNGLGTTSLLILVGVILDLSREIRSIILSNIYNEMFE